MEKWVKGRQKIRGDRKEKERNKQARNYIVCISITQGYMFQDHWKQNWE